MKNRAWFGRLAVCVALCVLTVIGCLPAYAGTEGEYGFSEVKVTYNNCGRETLTTGFIYNDDMLLRDAGEFSTDMTKASVALAMAAYNRPYAHKALQNMDFEIVGGEDAYDIASDMSIDDCDYVAYTIGRRYIGDSVAYCVPIRGTSKNAEWYSDFDLGTSGDHKGFYVAAGRLQDELYPILATDGYPAEKTIVWLTGHSRGAAVANIIAGELTRDGVYSTGDHVFAYNFACPSVSKSAVGYDNIYNFIGSGDLIPSLPLERWGYKRYGQTITLNLTLDGNFERRLLEETGDEFSSAANTSGYLALFTAFVKEESDYYNPIVQMAVKLVAHNLGGNNDVSDEELVEALMQDVGDLISDALWDVVTGNLHVIDLLESLKNAGNDIYNLITFIEENNAYVAGMTEEEYVVFQSEYAVEFESLKKYAACSTISQSAFGSIKAILEAEKGDSDEFSDILDRLVAMYFGEDGNIKDAIEDAHQQATYVLGVNSKYYGYAGWRGANVIFFNPDEDLESIGGYCFYDCEGLGDLNLTDNIRAIGENAFNNGCLTVLEIPTSVEYLGKGAFSRQKVLREVTLPVELSNANVFMETPNVESIHYTVGSTGIMSDRKYAYGEDNNYYLYTLEAQSAGALKSVDFAEGVVHIGDYAYYNSAGTGVLESLSLPSTLQSIGKYAFYDLANLNMEVVLPEGFNAIGENAFALSGITGIGIPTTLTDIPEACFYDCDGLTELDIHRGMLSLGNNCFGSCDGLVKVTLPVELSAAGPFNNTPNVESVYYTLGSTGVMPDRGAAYDGENYYCYTLEYCSSAKLQRADFEEGIVHIADYAFYNNYGEGALKELVIPSTLESIGKYAFTRLKQLAVDLELPEGLNAIGAHCFEGCPLKNVSLPSTLTYIPEYCFAECADMVTQMPAKVHTIDTRAFFGCTSLTTLEIPKTARCLGSNAFMNCTGLVEVTLPIELSGADVFTGVVNVADIHYTFSTTGVMPDRYNGGESTGHYCRSTLEFYSRPALKRVDFEEGIVHIGDYAFFYDWSQGALESVKLPATLKSVGAYAFYDQPKLIDPLVLPEGLETLGEYAFFKCAFPAINIPTTVAHIPGYCFSESAVFSKLVIPETVKSFGEWPFKGCSGVTYVEIPVELSFMYVLDSPNVGNILYTCGSTGVMPDRVEEGWTNNRSWCLEAYAKDALKRVEFSEGVVHIADYAFDMVVNDGRIEELILPSTLESIGRYAFNGQEALAIEITLPEGFTTLGEYCFNRTGLTRIHLPETVSVIPKGCFEDSAAMDIDMPESIRAIGEKAFWGCAGIDDLVIPVSVTEIGSLAFGGCSGLETVTLPVEMSISHIFDTALWQANVTDIHYTVASTGVMPDRTDDELTDPMDKNSALEHYVQGTLKNVVFDEGVVHIADYAFKHHEDDSGIEKLVLPSTLKSIGDYAFEGQKLLGEIVLPDCFEALGVNSFAYSSITGIKLPDSVEEIPDGCFKECTSLDMDLPANLRRIGVDAFSLCLSLDKLVIPENVTEIGKNAFMWCGSISEITIPVELYCPGAFSGLDSLETIRYYAVSDGVMPDRSIDDNADNCYSYFLERNAEALTTVIFEEGVTRIGEAAFYMERLIGTIENLTLPSTLVSIGDHAFRNQVSIKGELVLPEGFVELGDYAFGAPYQLTGLTLPSTLRSIGDMCFEGGFNIKNIAFNGPAPEVGTNIFNNVTADATYIPALGGWDDTMLTDHGGEINWIAVGPNVSINYAEAELILSEYAVGNSVRLVAYNAGVDITDIVEWVSSDPSVAAVENGCVTALGGGTAVITAQIAEDVAVSCKVTVLDDVPFMCMPAMLDTVCDEAFLNAVSMKAVILHDNITAIGDRAFAGCTGLAVIRIPDSVKTIGESAFEGCDDLRIYGVPGSFAQQYAAAAGIPFLAG